MALLQLGDDQSHLQTPVSQMHITDHVMSHKFADPLDTLSNDSRAQMSDMQWLGNIGPAVIYNNGLRMCRFVTAKSSSSAFISLTYFAR